MSGVWNSIFEWDNQVFSGHEGGIGLDHVKAHSRHAAIGTLLIYADEHDRQGTQRTLADLVARQLESEA